MERIDVAKLTPEYLFENHVAKRKPIVISGVPTDASFKAFERWTDISYLKHTAGAAKIKVEPMHKLKQQYGTDTPRLDTTFGAFLSTLEQDSAESYNYLTTQYADDDATSSEEEEKKQEAFPEPVRSLLRDVPLSPALMGNLALQQMNLWLGRSGRGASSGLHHDFHDNLYVLLKGRKRFVLFPPESVRHFKPYGELEKVHENGLIVYKAAGGDDGAQKDGIRADGLGERDAAGLRVKALEKKMEELQGVEGKEDELEGLEEIYDEAVENMMDYMMDEAEGEDAEEGDDFDDEELDGDEELGAVMEKIEAQLETDSTESTKGKKRKAEDDLNGHDKKATKGPSNYGGGYPVPDFGNDFGTDPDDLIDFDQEDDDDGVSFGAFADGYDSDDDQYPKASLAKAAATEPPPKEKTAAAAAAPQEPTEPLSFSQIPTQELHQHLGLTNPQKKSPSLSQAPEPLIVELKAGDMLYLPTSWWHEVTSFSEQDDDGGKRDSSIHMALNYWFHPPDRLESFQTPYQDDLVWEFIKGQVEEAYNELTRKA